MYVKGLSRMQTGKRSILRVRDKYMGILLRKWAWIQKANIVCFSGSLTVGFIYDLEKPHPPMFPQYVPQLEGPYIIMETRLARSWRMQKRGYIIWGISCKVSGVQFS